MTYLCSVDRAIEESNTTMNTMIKIPSRQRLVAERLCRHWTQLEVADQLGTTPGNVSRWERGITSPGPYFRSRLCELFGRSARELGLAWDESDDTLNPYTQDSALAPSFLKEALAQSHPSFTDRENLLGQVGILHRPETMAALSSFPANSAQSERNLPQQESVDQAWLTQTVIQYLQKLILDNIGSMVFVVLNSNVGSRPSSLQKSPSQRHTSHSEDCCDEYPPLRGTLRQRQGA
jgi:transcriptional regulator with XRE-family HTH domain